MEREISYRRLLRAASVLGLMIAIAMAAPAPVAACDGPHVSAASCSDRAAVTNLLRQAIDAKQSGDLDRADELYRAVLRHWPDYHDGRRALHQIAERRTLPRESEAYQTVRQLLPARFREHETRRFVVFSDADVNWTRQQAERLERAHHQFHRFTRRLGVEPLPLQHKLVCVLFATRDDYAQFASQHDGVSDPWIAGYYAPQHDRIVFYHVEANPGVTKARSKIGSMLARYQELAEQANHAARQGDSDRARAIREDLARYQQHIDRESRRVETYASQVSVATTIHEAVHQLSFHTRVQSPYVQYPLWISEGLATAFETDRPNEAFGPDREYEPRRDEFLRLAADGVLLPMDELARVTSLRGACEQTVSIVYHQSYALVTWMSRFEREALREYLLTMLHQPAEPLSPERHLEIFTAAFGDPAEMERAWLRYEVAQAKGTEAAIVLGERLAAQEAALADRGDDARGGVSTVGAGGSSSVVVVEQPRD